MSSSLPGTLDTKEFHSLRYLRGTAFLTGRKNNCFFNIAAQKQGRKQLPLSIVQDIGTINNNESNPGCGCQSELECDAESEPLRFRELLSPVSFLNR